MKGLILVLCKLVRRLNLVEVSYESGVKLLTGKVGEWINTWVLFFLFFVIIVRLDKIGPVEVYNKNPRIRENNLQDLFPILVLYINLREIFDDNK